MAGIYCGIHLKLKSPRTPCPDKPKLKDDVKIRQHLTKEIRRKVDAVLQSALFIPEHLLSYREEVLPSEDKAGAKTSQAGKGLQGPVNMVLLKLNVQGANEDEEALFYAVKSNSLPLLFKFALDSFCKGGDNKQVIFHLMTKIITALGFTDELDIDQKFSASNWGIVLLALENLLNSSLGGDIYNVAADRIQHREVQLNFYRKLARLIFNNTQMGIPAWYRCLRALLTLNHHILEPDLDELLSAVWVDVDNMEVRVRKAREALVSAVLQTYTKLRQVPKLIEELLDVVCQPAADELRPPLLPEMKQKTLSQCLLDNPLKLSMMFDTNQIWDFQFCTVNANTYMTAYWFLVTSNLPLTTPYLEANDRSVFAECILKFLLQSLDASGSNLENTGISVSLISRKLLKSFFFVSSLRCSLHIDLSAAMTSLFSLKGLYGLIRLSFLQSVQDFIQSLIQLIIDRKSSMCVNLEKFTSFMVESNLTAGVLAVDAGDLCSLQLHLVTLSMLCKEMITSLGKNEQLDQTLTHLLEKATSVMEPAIQAVLMRKGSRQRKSFSVEIVTVMIRSELARASISENDSFCQQILKELIPAPRPLDFLISSLCVLHGTWMSLSDVKELEGPVKELLNQLVSSCSQEQFHLLLLMLREGLVPTKIEGGHCTTLTILLRQGEAKISNPQHVIVDYHAAFEAIHEALFTVIHCYPQVMLKASPTFLNGFYRLVSSVMHEGRQRGDSDRESLLKCATLVERMYTHIANAAEDFTVLIHRCTLTLQPEIKAHLTKGIYCILDRCVEQDIKFLNTTLQMGVKEVFSELYNILMSSDKPY
uniref:URB2 ribosome biogenesis homolog n=1 Tax=Cyprinus carpio TaxID=7962 RepID=A0A8C2KLF7_CYPCA